MDMARFFFNATRLASLFLFFFFFFFWGGGRTGLALKLAVLRGHAASDP